MALLHWITFAVYTACDLNVCLYSMSSLKLIFLYEKTCPCFAFVFLTLSPKLWPLTPDFPSPLPSCHRCTCSLHELMHYNLYAHAHNKATNKHLFGALCLYLSQTIVYNLYHSQAYCKNNILIPFTKEKFSIRLSLFTRFLHYHKILEPQWHCTY